MRADIGVSEDGRSEKEDPGTTPAVLPQSFRLVGMGASAGGLRALKVLFEAIPADSGLAYVVIVHLDPDHESQMANLLQSGARIPVTQISSTFTPEPNHAYVIPPNSNLTAVNGTVELSTRDRHAPIDLFFRTLAHVYGTNSVGVVLSGTGADGTAGLRWIRDAGGITIAQTPDEAEYKAMPKSAIASGQVDLVLPAAEIPARLIDLTRDDSRRSLLDDPLVEDVGESLGRIVAALRRHTGHDFGGHKRSSMLRRVQRRMRFRKIDTLADYARLLRGDSEEVDRLFHDLLISVSGFFRDAEAFAALEREVIPKLFAGKGPEDHVRVWVAGCATGEEAYSLAILLSEHQSTLTAPPGIQIFATDIDEAAWRRARTGAYPGTIASELSPERLERWFKTDVKGLRVKEALREVVLFAAHDMLRDPPFSKLDLVSCRNVMIYLKPPAQKSLLNTFGFALLPHGYLFLGASEFIGDSGMFATVDATNRIYRRLPKGPRDPVGADIRPVEEASPRPEMLEGVSVPATGFSYGPIHLRMLEAYAPPSVIVDANATIVHLSQLAGRYVRLSGGVPSANLFDLVSGDLRLELRSALGEALDSGVPIQRTVKVEIDAVPRVVDLHVSPLKMGDQEVYALIVFDEHVDVDGAVTDDDDDDAPGRAAIVHLEQELRRAREQLGATLEERDITVEELWTTNEELQSINEQYRTGIEEMETSQEEFQSLNEELTTINQEHLATIEELNQTTADLVNFLGAVNIATIFLDRELNVRRFSPAVASIFSLTPPDIGRPLSHVTHRLRYDLLIDDAKRVMSSVEPVEREARDDTGKWYNVRMRPYLSQDQRIDGVVITFYDVTEASHYREAEHAARLQAEAQTGRIEALMRQMPAGVLVVDVPSGEIVSANDRAHAIWGHGGLPAAASLGAGDSWVAAYKADGTRYATDEWPVSRLIRTGRDVRDEEVQLQFADGRKSVLLINAAPVHYTGGGKKGEVDAAIVTFLDVTGRKRMEEDLLTAKLEAERANRAKGLFMATLSHEFRTPLNGIMGYADLLAQDKGLDEQQRRRADRIQTAVRHLAVMVEQILGLAGLHEELESFADSTLDARGTARAAANICEPVATAAGLTLSVNVPDDPVPLTTDHNRLRMILINLLGNAVKFTEQGEVRLELHPEADRVRFEVHDTGIGIAEENHELIFERFFQVSKGLTRSAGGMGIGLYAAREFSRMLGGDIEVQGALGQGSVFTLWLPLTPPAGVPSPPNRPGGGGENSAQSL